MLDVLVCHYNEPAEMVGSFLDMLDSQDAAGFGVIIGNDGHDVPIPPDVIGSRRYPVRYVETYHGGISHIRNVLLHESDGDYVAFCDCDDRYLDGGLRRLIRLCDGCDVVRTSFLSITRHGDTVTFPPDMELFHGKAFRREYVMGNAAFDEDLIVSRDSHFILQATLNTKSIVDFHEPIYVWEYRGDSVFRGLDGFGSLTHWYRVESYGRLTDMYSSNQALCGMFACRLVHTSYLEMHTRTWQRHSDDFRCRFAVRCLAWWLERHYDTYMSVSEGGRRHRYELTRRCYGTDLPFEGIDEWAHKVMETGTIADSRRTYCHILP